MTGTTHDGVHLHHRRDVDRGSDRSLFSGSDTGSGRRAMTAKPSAGELAKQQPRFIPNPLWCSECDGRGYLVVDAEWEPHAVQCQACKDRRSAPAQTGADVVRGLVPDQNSASGYRLASPPPVMPEVEQRDTLIENAPEATVLDSSSKVQREQWLDG
jgi:hypothetical protein